MRVYLFLCLVTYISHGSSCSGKHSKITITQTPVFSEIDTFENNIFKDHPFSRHDYFLVEGNVNDKISLKDSIDGFVKSHVNEECTKYQNYIMFFYRRSPEVNEAALNKMDNEYRYKIFQYTKDDNYIASFDCWMSIPDKSVDFQDKYK